jgi:hypothetical protein
MTDSASEARRRAIPVSDRYDELKGRLPASYVRFIEARDGWEGDPGEGLGHLALWDRAGIRWRWDAYEMAEFLGDRWFPIGSDGGGEILCFDLDAGGDAVFALPFIGMGDETPVRWFASFARRIEADA